MERGWPSTTAEWESYNADEARKIANRNAYEAKQQANRSNELLEENNRLMRELLARGIDIPQ